MAGYTPSIEDMAYLIQTQPDKFKDPLGSSRAIRNAMKGGGDDVIGAQIENTTTTNQYRQYLKGGGEPLTKTPIPAEPAADDDSEIVDQPFAAACPPCQSLAPCCVEKVEFGCAHKDARWVLPVAEGKEGITRLALIASEGEAPDGHDIFKANAVITPNPNCKLGGKPSLRLRGDYVDAEKIAPTLEEKLVFPDQSGPFNTASNLGKLAALVENYIWGDIRDSAEKMHFSILNCANETSFDFPVDLYPSCEFEGGINFGVAGRYSISGGFMYSVSIGGSISGKYAGSSFEIEAGIEKDSDTTNHVSSIIPFLDNFQDAMRSRFSDASAKENVTSSYIEITHEQSWGNCKYELVEHPDDPSSVGIEATVSIAFAPLIGVKIHIDVIEALFRAAAGTAQDLVTAIQQAREKGAKGIKNKSGTLEGSLHAAVFLEGEGKLGNGTLELTRSAGDEHWIPKAKLDGSVALTLGVEIKATAKVYFIEGTLDVNGKATSKLTLGVESISENERVGDEKLKAKLEWGGVKLKYKGEVKGKALGFGAAARDEGVMEIFNKEELGAWEI